MRARHPSAALRVYALILAVNAPDTGREANHTCQERSAGDVKGSIIKDMARINQTAADSIQRYKKLGRSFFVALTLPNLQGAEAQIQAACDGVQLVELRVDLLEQQEDFSSFKEFVVRQVRLLRSYTDLDILFTVRTKTQGGSFPDGDPDGLVELYKLGLDLGVEFLDVEMQLDAKYIEEIVSLKGSTALLMSHHDWVGQLSWADGSWKTWYEKGLEYGDIVKLVGTAQAFKDNIALETFRGAVRQPEVPLIAINMGRAGQTSRILNNFMTPVTHPALSKAAPGQLSVSEIRQAMALMGLD